MYLYNPDDEDQLNRLLGQSGGEVAPDAGALSPTQPVQTPQPAAAQPSQQDGLLQSLLAAQAAKRDPELDQMLTDREKQALRESATPQYGGAELARDVIGPGAALIVDLVANHGRGATGILATGAQAAQQNRAADVARAQQNAELAIKMHAAAGKQADPLTQALAVDRAITARTNAGTNITKTDNAQNRFVTHRNDLIDPNSEFNQSQIAVAGSKAGAAATGRQNALHALNPQMAGDAANIRAAQTGAQIETTLGYAPQTAAAAAQQAAGVETAKVGAERAAQGANRPLPPGYYARDPALFANTNEDQGARGKMLADTMVGRQLGEAADKMAALRAQNGPQWVPNQTSGEYQALQTAVIGAANRVIADAGTLNAGERELMLRLVPGIEPNWKDLVGWMAGADLNAQQLEGYAKGLRMILDSRAASYGLGYGQDPNAAPRAPAPGAPKMAPPPSKATPLKEPDPELLQRYGVVFQ